MESPKSWDMLTSALSVSNLTDPLGTWWFLLEVGVVADGPDHAERFEQIVGEVLAQGEITGPSFAARIAGRLDPAMVGARGRAPDPDGKIAERARYERPVLAGLLEVVDGRFAS